MNRTILIVSLFLFSMHARSQNAEGIDQPRPYYIEPQEYASNNRWYSDCKSACINRANHNASCSVYRITSKKNASQNDSVLVAIYYFGPNGFIDSAWFAEQNKPFKYTKVGGRVVKNMQCDCDDIKLAKGNPNSTATEEADKYMSSTSTFDPSGYIKKQVDMKNGVIRYNDSWDGNSNVKTEYQIDSTENLRMKIIYLSHTRFFGKPRRRIVYLYDSHNNYTGRIEYENGEVQKYSLIYTTR